MWNYPFLIALAAIVIIAVFQFNRIRIGESTNKFTPWFAVAGGLIALAVWLTV